MMALSAADPWWAGGSADIISNCTAADCSRLTILATRNVRGRVLPVDEWSGDCEYAGANIAEYKLAATYCVGKGMCGECSGGAAAHKHYVDAVRAERGASSVLLLDSGNYYFGSMFCTFLTEILLPGQAHSPQCKQPARRLHDPEPSRNTPRSPTHCSGFNPNRSHYRSHPCPRSFLLTSARAPNLSRTALVTRPSCRRRRQLPDLAPVPQGGKIRCNRPWKHGVL